MTVKNLNRREALKTAAALTITPGALLEAFEPTPGLPGVSKEASPGLPVEAPSPLRGEGAVSEKSLREFEEVLREIDKRFIIPLPPHIHFAMMFHAPKEFELRDCKFTVEMPPNDQFEGREKTFNISANPEMSADLRYKMQECLLYTRRQLAFHLNFVARLAEAHQGWATYALSKSEFNQAAGKEEWVILVRDWIGDILNPEEINLKDFSDDFEDCSYLEFLE